MDFQTLITIIFALFAIAEVAQVWLLRSAVMQIKERMDSLVPDGKRAGTVLAETAIDFMKMISENKEGEAQVVGGFVRGCAQAAFDEVKGSIPVLGAASNMDENLERIAKRNPWAGLILSGMQVAGPLLQAQMQQKGGVNVPTAKTKGVAGYG